MESSIAVFLLWHPACEQVPMKSRSGLEKQCASSKCSILSFAIQAFPNLRPMMVFPAGYAHSGGTEGIVT